MASKSQVEITILGAGNSLPGLRILGFIARMFHIRLEVCPTQRPPDLPNAPRQVVYFCKFCNSYHVAECPNTASR